MRTTLSPWSPGVGLSTWDSASNYAGDRPDGYYVYTTHRDADLLRQSNYDAILKALTEAETAANLDYTCVDEHDFGHWAVGWTRQIVIRPSAPESVIRLAESLLECLEEYPVLDDDDYSEREWTASADYWSGLSPREKVEHAMRERDECHWLAKTPVWRFGRYSWYDLGVKDCEISRALEERVRSYVIE